MSLHLKCHLTQMHFHFILAFTVKMQKNFHFEYLFSPKTKNWQHQSVVMSALFYKHAQVYIRFDTVLNQNVAAFNGSSSE